jgi:hypothetical protein
MNGVQKIKIKTKLFKSMSELKYSLENNDLRKNSRSKINVTNLGAAWLYSALFYCKCKSDLTGRQAEPHVQAYVFICYSNFWSDLDNGWLPASHFRLQEEFFQTGSENNPVS